MITVNDPSGRLAGKKIPEIVAPYGIDFTVNGVRFTVTPTPSGLEVQKKTDSGLDSIIIEPAHQNKIFIK